jgi:hypothetical protein
MPDGMRPPPGVGVPYWADPKNASVFDAPGQGLLRSVVKWLGLDDPAIVMQVGVPLEGGAMSGGMLEKLAEKFPRLAGVIKAYHGSPHDFEKFETAKIGTGEGAQAYGHGLYFAEQEATAKAYRDQLSQGTNVIVDGVKRAINTENGADLALLHLASGNTGPQATAAIRRGFTPQYANDYEAALTKYAGRVAPVKGSMYEVAIKAHPDQFLDWDKPLSQQPANVKSALATVAPPYGLPEAEGGTLYQSLAHEIQARTMRTPGQKHMPIVAAKAEVSRQLADAGIPGIKYLDQGSRPVNVVQERLRGLVEKHGGDLDAGVDEFMRSVYDTPQAKATMRASLVQNYKPGTHNYVVFDENTIEILRKYGILLPAVGAGAMEAQRPQ